MDKPQSYIEKLLSTLNTQKELLELLKERALILDQIIEDKFRVGTSKILELNGHKIERIKVKAEIAAVENVVKERTKYYETYVIDFDKKKFDMEKNWSAVINEAKKRRATDASVENFLKSVNWDILADNVEAKVHCYGQLLKLLKWDNL